MISLEQRPQKELDSNHKPCLRVSSLTEDDVQNSKQAPTILRANLWFRFRNLSYFLGFHQGLWIIKDATFVVCQPCRMK